MLDFTPALLAVTVSVAATIIGMEVVINTLRSMDVPARVAYALGQWRSDLIRR